MSKYFSLYQTDAQFNAASATLDYPHVSLIDTTGEVKFYRKFLGKDIVDADFGDLIMVEVSTNKLFNIKDSEYNLTDYPLESYKPIAVCIYDRASNANGQAVFMAVQWADYTELGTPKASNKNMSWGFYNIDMSSKVTNIRDQGTNHISSIAINTAMKTLVTKDYSGSSITDTYGDGESSAFCSCWRFVTPGTSAGDWLLPSYYDMMKYQQNYSTINSKLTTVKNVAGSSYLNTVNYLQWVACELSNTNAYFLRHNGSWNYSSKNYTNDYSVRPVFVTSLSL